MRNLILITSFFIIFSCSQNSVNKENTNTIDTTTTNVKTPETIIDTTQISTAKTSNTKDSNLVSTQNGERIASSNNGFISFYQKMIVAINNKDVKSFNQLFDADFGLYIIYSKGAMPKISKIYHIEDFKELSSSFMNMKFDKIKETPQKENLPRVVCDKEIYDKKGCFYQETNPLEKSQIWNYANLNDKEIQPIQILSDKIKITVINTFNYTFYFTFSENQWHLAFIDLRQPCNA